MRIFWYNEQDLQTNSGHLPDVAMIVEVDRLTICPETPFECTIGLRLPDTSTRKFLGIFLPIEACLINASLSVRLMQVEYERSSRLGKRLSAMISGPQSR